MAEPASAPRHRLRLFADGCHVLLCTMLWLAGNVLVALGMVLGVAILAADAQPALFFAHVHNLSDHYLAANPGRRAQFDQQIVALNVAILTLLLLARLPGFVQRMRRELSDG